LEFAWPEKYFSEKKGCCLPRSKDDDMAEVYNVVIKNAQSKANTIHKKYLISGHHMTLESFIRDFKSDLNKNDFVSYIEKKAYHRWDKKLISGDTYDAEKSVINKLKAFQPSIPFNTFNTTWAKLWDNFLKKKGNGENTRWGNHKIIQTYLSLAKTEDKITFDDPYGRFTNKMVESSWGPLEVQDLQKLIIKYFEWKDKPLPPMRAKPGVKNQKDEREGLTFGEIIIIRKFLFACNSSLRISDMQELDEDIFKNGEMTITPHKTERYGTKIKSIPLSELARILLQDEIDFVRAQRSDTSWYHVQRGKSNVRIFETYTDQTCNKFLKRIAGKCDLKRNLHMHVARYTFGTLMDEAGANHTAVMKMMGIVKRDTFNKYVKTNKNRISEGMDKFNEFTRLPLPETVTNSTQSEP
jgi:integrase